MVDDAKAYVLKKDGEQQNYMLSREQLKFLRASDSAVPWLYGMPKVHKKDCPVREISSAVGSCGHDLAAALIASYVRDGDDFVEMIQQKLSRFKRAARKGGKMVSLDIKAMFPNIPMEEALKV
jgi:nanoRNase/pAp phosphatase (c-di-AMP/oligoRNAs hydrolase)